MRPAAMSKRYILFEASFHQHPLFAQATADRGATPDNFISTSLCLTIAEILCYITGSPSSCRFTP